MEQTSYKDYESSTIDVEEVDGADIKITPDFYIHKAILKAQECLSKDDIKQGYAQYRQFIEHIETLTKASNMTPTDFDNKVTEFIGNLNKDDSEMVKSVKIANYKLELIMSRIFSQKLSTEPMKA